ncbi:MAG: hypothetical protein HQL78_07385 [Magnetococcales bacterium]|nr:hypothetical protein [Magnetococcales bacterium]
MGVKPLGRGGTSSSAWAFAGLAGAAVDGPGPLEPLAAGGDGAWGSCPLVGGFFPGGAIPLDGKTMASDTFNVSCRDFSSWARASSAAS